MLVFGTLSGLTSGLHGFHVHQFGDLTQGVFKYLLLLLHLREVSNLYQGASSTGMHFNPFNMNHGAPNATSRFEDKISKCLYLTMFRHRHVGDLGNIAADGDGTASFSFSVTNISLVGPYSIIGRAVIVCTLRML